MIGSGRGIDGTYYHKSGIYGREGSWGIAGIFGIWGLAGIEGK